jgi:hypothetical protein
LLTPPPAVSPAPHDDRVIADMPSIDDVSTTSALLTSSDAMPPEKPLSFVMISECYVFARSRALITRLRAQMTMRINRHNQQ